MFSPTSLGSVCLCTLLLISTFFKSISKILRCAADIKYLHLEPSICMEAMDQVCLGENEEMSVIDEDDTSQVRTERKTFLSLDGSTCLTHVDSTLEPLDLNIKARVTSNSDHCDTPANIDDISNPLFLSHLIP
ncbi:hypothetical protein F0562_021605 [Nyssa sinensis]|uniref:Uncharacterized protein n=1 Tax=Nyssa sinensis TaxID=561372 RepID=A0A5J5BLD6_9ASTE|nr:hypothetical protein F0562_021605 [Nyssa sinensis]